jgi:hypothetical protein
MEYKNRNNASKAEIEAIPEEYMKYKKPLMENTYIQKPRTRISHIKEIQQKIMNRSLTRNNATKNRAERAVAAGQIRTFETLQKYMKNLALKGSLGKPINTSGTILTRINEDAARIVPYRSVNNARTSISTLHGLAHAETAENNVRANATQSYMNSIPYIGRTLEVANGPAVERWTAELTRRQAELQDKQRLLENGLLRPRPSEPLRHWQDTLFNPSDGIALSKPNPKDNVTDLIGLIDDFKVSQKPTLDAPLGTVYGVNRTTNMYGFVHKIFLNPMMTMDEMVSFMFSPGRHIGNDSYESLSRLFVFFGGIPEVNPREDGDYKFVDQFEIDRKAGEEHIPFERNIDMLNNVSAIGLNDSGFSDVTLIHNSIFDETEPPINGKKVYLMSVKWLGEESTATKSYDIETLRSFSMDIAQYIPGLRPSNVINLVFLKNRGEFADKCMSAKRHEEEWCEQIYGWNEDVKPFLQTIRNKIFSIADQKLKTPLQIFDEMYTIHIPNNANT